ncbi:hypothetical protein [Halospeciosus flavus]|uniref:DUF7835 domain-containing protein n=1 Tax=Halospeciosus flavus TaxID=3032283 RepID=A0ABD5Z6K7_9EURY|nr:hypothetical protein [Halospeciosus flavus]
MASKTPHSDGIVEPCDNCGRETAHEVSIELLTESDDSENAAYSREPYRVTECRACGEESHQRMNDA